jgi:hypothetical protein
LVAFPNEGDPGCFAAGIELPAQFLGGRFLLLFVLTSGVLREDHRKRIATVDCRSTRTEQLTRPRRVAGVERLFVLVQHKNKLHPQKSFSLKVVSACTGYGLPRQWYQSVHPPHTGWTLILFNRSVAEVGAGTHPNVRSGTLPKRHPVSLSAGG